MDPADLRDRIDALAGECPFVAGTHAAALRAAREALSRGELERAGALVARLERTLLREPFDAGAAFVSVHIASHDAAPWARQVMQMLLRYGERRAMRAELLRETRLGDGIRSASLRLSGPLAFVLPEAGVHRLIERARLGHRERWRSRLVAVTVLPEIPERELPLARNALRVETFRASGPGGQHVNTTDSAVRVTHLPTGITATVQSERSQHRNLAIALAVLRARLHEHQRAARERRLQAFVADERALAAGRAIRNYRWHPPLVRDLRTGVETSDVRGVLHGRLHRFAAAWLCRYRGVENGQGPPPAP